MHIVFVHGWSVTSTDTYGDLPQYLRQQASRNKLNVSVAEIFLGKYVSFEDTVNIDDIARAFDAALHDHPTLARVWTTSERFACITHSTGAPVVRHWLHRYYGQAVAKSPMSHLIMLAPANHGSALAQLGKGRLARIKGHFDGVEPGVRVLNWLELGSDESWALNARYIDYDLVSNGVYPFVLQGQTIDRKLYDVLNSYTDEMGSDGVVRVAAANMNFALLRLRQSGDNLIFDEVNRSAVTALGILPGLAHSGKDIGIIRSVKLSNAADHPTTKAVLQCLQVNTAKGYTTAAKDFERLSNKTQTDEMTRRAKLGPFSRTFKTNRCAMLVFRLVDDTGLALTDYDLTFTAGREYDENSLPPGFFVDRQRNLLNRGKLTYYLNYDVLIDGLKSRLQNRFGLKVAARPDRGLSCYAPASFRGTGQDIVKAIRPNETLMVEIVVQRRVDRAVFTLTDKLDESEPISAEPTGEIVPPLA